MSNIDVFKQLLARAAKEYSVKLESYPGHWILSYQTVEDADTVFAFTIQTDPLDGGKWGTLWIGMDIPTGQFVKIKGAAPKVQKSGKVKLVNLRRGTLCKSTVTGERAFEIVSGFLLHPDGIRTVTISSTSKPVEPELPEWLK